MNKNFTYIYKNINLSSQSSVVNFWAKQNKLLYKINKHISLNNKKENSYKDKAFTNKINKIY